MGVGKGILWKGTYHTVPGASSVLDSSELSPMQLGSGNKLVVLGNFTGLIPPKTLMQVTPSTANIILHPSNEEARLAIQLAFNPSQGDTQGAQQCYLMAVNPSTPSYWSGTDGYTINSYMYGYPANQIRIKQLDGTNTGTHKMVIQFEDAIETIDNIEHKLFSVTYKGNDAACLLSINTSESTGTNPHSLTTVCSSTTINNLNIDFKTYTTVRTLVDAINTPTFVDGNGATQQLYEAIIISDSNAIDKCMRMDTLTDEGIKYIAATQPLTTHESGRYTVKGDLQALINSVNTISGYVQADWVTDGIGVIPDNYPFIYLTGGANGVDDVTSWQECMDVLKQIDIQILLTLTDDSSHIKMVDTHCQSMSNQLGRSERIQLMGGTPHTWTNGLNRLASIAAMIGWNKQFNSDRTVNAGLGSSHYDPTGIAKKYPAYITAAMYAGLAAGSSIEVPITRKYLNCLALETDLTGEEVAELLENGIAVPMPDTVQGAGYVVSRGLTTWNGDADLSKIEISVRRGTDYIAKEIRKRHALIIGSPGTEQIDVTIINITNAVLELAQREGKIRSYDKTKTQLRAIGTVRYVDYSATPILPINWIFSTYHAQPLNITVTL